MIVNVDCVVKFNNEFIDMKINIDKCFKKKKTLTKYNIYIKNNFHRIKAIYPELKAPEIIRIIAKEWQPVSHPHFWHHVCQAAMKKASICWLDVG